jgi:integrase/recombinase XerC
MIAAGRRPATINRRLETLRRLGRWAHTTGTLAVDVVRDVRPVRTVRNRQPAGLTDSEVHAMLRAAGASGHGLAARNCALMQLMLQTGIRVGELAMLRVGDVIINDRSCSLRIRQGKGLKAREAPRSRRPSNRLVDPAMMLGRPHSGGRIRIEEHQIGIGANRDGPFAGK